MNTAKTVVHVANSEKIGGGNRTMMLLVESLDASRFRSLIVSPREGALTEWASAHAVGWRVLPDRIEGHLGFVTQVAFLSRLFLRERASLVHAHSPWTYRAAALAGRLTGVKRVCHIQFPLDWSDLAWHTKFGVDAIVTCYQKLASELSESSPAGRECRLVAIPNTVDADRFTPLTIDYAPARERWRSGADQIVVMVGHLSDVKGYPTFLEAAARIRSVLPKCRFLAVGGETLERGYQAKLNDMVARLALDRAVDFLGWREDVPDILRAADVMVLPSLAEGLPLAVLEAMACGVPVVATDVNGTPEAVVNGETGLLVRPNDAAALAGSVLRLLENPTLRRHMGAAARERIERCFTLRQFTPRVQSLYDELLTA